MRFLLALGATVIVVSVYGTIQDLGRAPAPDAPPDPERGARLLRDTYRDRALPHGWELESVERHGDGAFVVTLRFNPQLNDARYGRPADPAAVAAAMRCPADPEAVRHAGISALRLRARDKTGIIAELDCATGHSG